MLIGICEMCGRESKDRQLDSHHALPRRYGGTNEDIIQICRSCHGKADDKFNRYILYPFEINTWHDEEKFKKSTQKYYRKYRRYNKIMFVMHCDSHAYLHIVLIYNIKTKCPTISHSWTWTYNKKNRAGERKYRKKNYKSKLLYWYKINSNARHSDVLSYNIKTKHICITHVWYRNYHKRLENDFSS